MEGEISEYSDQYHSITKWMDFTCTDETSQTIIDPHIGPPSKYFPG